MICFMRENGLFTKKSGNEGDNNKYVKSVGVDPMMMILRR